MKLRFKIAACGGYAPQPQTPPPVDMAKAIIRAQKLKTFQAIGMTDVHNRREYDVMPEHITQSRTELNRVYSYDFDKMTRSDTGGLNEKLKKRLEELNITPRKNAVLAVEYVMTASNELWSKYSPDAYLDYCERFIAERHGEKNVLSIARHYDESNPHIHVVVVPIDSKNKLNCRDFLGGPQKMRDLQDDYFNYMKKWGITTFGITERDKKRKSQPEKYIDRTSRVLGDLRNDYQEIKADIGRTAKNLQESLKTGDLERVKHWVREMELKHQQQLKALENKSEKSTEDFKKAIERDKPLENKSIEPPLSPNNKDVMAANKTKTSETSVNQDIEKENKKKKGLSL